MRVSSASLTHQVTLEDMSLLVGSNCGAWSFDSQVLQLAGPRQPNQPRSSEAGIRGKDLGCYFSLAL